MAVQLLLAAEPPFADAVLAMYLLSWAIGCGVLFTRRMPLIRRVWIAIGVVTLLFAAYMIIWPIYAAAQPTHRQTAPQLRVATPIIRLQVVSGLKPIVVRSSNQGVQKFAWNLKAPYKEVLASIRADLKTSGGWIDRSVPDTGGFLKRWSSGKLSRTTITVLPVKLDDDLVGVTQPYSGWTSVTLQEWRRNNARSQSLHRRR
ncbi:MAG TPA: hypothetical protein VK934_06225 [Fimbriimonas sp.]|nr:hypothetical protein [Fimbriimonas sp.]